jgi:hypothetical protein
MLLPRTSLLALLAAGAFLASGCGSSNDSVTWVNTDTEQTQSATQTPTVDTTTVPTTTVPTTSVPASTTPTTSSTTTTAGPTGGATIPQDGGASSDATGGTTVPNDTGSSSSSTSPTTSTTTQDPDCKPGTGPGFPDSPQCEPASGPDSRPDDAG